MLIRSKSLQLKGMIDETITEENEKAQTKTTPQVVLTGGFCLCLCCSSGIQCSKGLYINNGENFDTDSVITIR